MKVSYKFVTKEKTEIEVNEELGNEIALLSRKIHANNKYQKRLQHPMDIEPNDYGGHTVDDFYSCIEQAYFSKLKHTDIQTLHKAFTTLSHEQKDLVSRVFFVGQSIKEIADHDGVSAPAIHNRLHKIYAKLRKQF